MLNGCSNCLWFSALVALLVLPAPYFVPDVKWNGPEDLVLEQLRPESKPWLSFSLPPHDIHIVLTLALSLWALLTCLYYWIQVKLVERRIGKLNGYLQDALDRVKLWDTRQRQVEATLKMVNNATAEYNLLLHLLMQRRKLLSPQYLYDKDLDMNETPRTLDV